MKRSKWYVRSFFIPQCVHLVIKSNIDLLDCLIWVFQQIVLKFKAKTSYFLALNQKTTNIMGNLFWRRKKNRKVKPLRYWDFCFIRVAQLISSNIVCLKKKKTLYLIMLGTKSLNYVLISWIICLLSFLLTLQLELKWIFFFFNN